MSGLSGAHRGAVEGNKQLQTLNEFKQSLLRLDEFLKGYAGFSDEAIKQLNEIDTFFERFYEAAGKKGAAEEDSEVVFEYAEIKNLLKTLPDNVTKTFLSDLSVFFNEENKFEVSKSLIKLLDERYKKMLSLPDDFSMNASESYIKSYYDNLVSFIKGLDPLTVEDTAAEPFLILKCARERDLQILIEQRDQIKTTLRPELEL